jgi:hypothetical protein
MLGRRPRFENGKVVTSDHSGSARGAYEPREAIQDGAFGRPGIEPRWTHGDKDGVGTAYAVSSRIWFTLWNGIITEVYYPTVDHPQIRDLQYLITDGKTFFHEEKRNLKSICERLSDQSLGYRYGCTRRSPRAMPDS